MQDRLDRTPEPCACAAQTVEHPFGTLKAWMGATHFKTRTLEKGQNRDEPARPGLQSEARDRHPGRRAADGGHPGLMPYRRQPSTSSAFS